MKISPFMFIVCILLSVGNAAANAAATEIKGPILTPNNPERTAEETLAEIDRKIAQGLLNEDDVYGAIATLNGLPDNDAARRLVRATDNVWTYHCEEGDQIETNWLVDNGAKGHKWHIRDCRREPILVVGYEDSFTPLLNLAYGNVVAKIIRKDIPKLGTQSNPEMSGETCAWVTISNHSNELDFITGGQDDSILINANTLGTNGIGISMSDSRIRAYTISSGGVIRKCIPN